MKSDIDALMQEAQLDALLVNGSAMHNPNMVYFTGPVHVSSGLLIKKRGEQPVLICAAMEREEAARTGLHTRMSEDFGWRELIEQTGGDHIQAMALERQRMLREYEVAGRVALYGRLEIGTAYALFARLLALSPEIELVGESMADSVLLRARATKDEDEIARLRAIGKTTTAVVGEVASFLTSHQVKDGVLTSRDGAVLTVGEVKRRINLWLTMRGAENPEGTIFALGRDAGIPHSAGTDDDPLRVGTPIIFDLYPCEAGGGYFYDMTRTWCLGHAPDEVLRVYEDVLDVYQRVVGAMKVDELFRQYQRMTCELFEAKNHPTKQSAPKSLEGYTHSLGHGVGLAVHEMPFAADEAGNEMRLLPGSVVTAEPGLYYPDRGLGVRLEDTLWVRPDGAVEALADFPKDLVLEMPEG